MRLLSTILFLATWIGYSLVFAQSRDTTITASIEGHIFKPAVVKPESKYWDKLQTPDGFAVEIFAEGLGKPRMMAVSDDGTVYVSRRDQEDIVMLRDTNRDGKSDEQKTALQKKQVHGLAIREGQLYFVTVNEVYRVAIREDGSLAEPEQIMADLPDGGQHANRTIEFGPDGKIYLSVGSTCNACEETSEESATLIVANADGTDRRIFSRGLRNTIGFDWHPVTQQLWGIDHGIDWLGDEEQKEEVNLLEDGNDYGWPYIYGDGNYNPADEPKNGVSHAEYAKKVTLPSLLLPAHSAPLDMIFYDAEQFPEEYRGDAIVTLHGSWNRKDPSGYKVIRIHYDEQGQPTECSDLVSGFLVDDKQGQFGRVTGLAMLADGSVLVSDDSGGVIYRVSYKSR